MRLSLMSVIRKLAILITLLSASAAYAQSPVGTRAEGMAGAYVGVADDATAVYWNPAGVASAPIVSAVVSLGIPVKHGDSAQSSVDKRDKGGIVAVSATAIGVAYYRLTAYGLGALEPAVTGSNSREEVGRSVHAITTQTVGVSLVQSLTENIVVGATPKFVRADDGNAIDVDAGVMYSRHHVRLGLVARNLTAPSFESG